MYRHHKKLSTNRAAPVAADTGMSSEEFRLTGMSRAMFCRVVMGTAADSERSSR